MGDALRFWHRENRLLTLAVWWNAALLVLALLALPFDHRHILGLNPWIKPMKFDVSVLIYVGTAAVLLRLLRDGWRRTRLVVGGGIALAMIVENSIISLQSLRGVRSHMNYSTAFDGAAFGVMGLFILLNTLMVAGLLGLWLMRQPRLPPALVWGVRLGLVAFLAGSVEGFLMVQHGGHTVGAHDGGAGLAFVNWSTGHGDLRIAHFFALHALQAMPLIGWALTRTRLPARLQVTGTWLLSLAYLAVVWLLFHQAMSGRPLLG